MSYILEALKKVEQQRELGRVPGIGSEHDAGAGSVSRRWVWGVLLVVNAAILLLLVLLWLRTDSAEIRVPDPVSIAEPVAGVTAVPATPYPPKAELAPLPGPVEPALAPVSPVKPARFTAPPDIQPLPPPAQQLATRSVTPVENAELPVWPQVPEHLLARLSDGLRLDVHVYSEQAADRFVLINLTKYREGEVLGNGSIVQEITPRGAVISSQGERFRLLAQ